MLLATLSWPARSQDPSEPFRVNTSTEGDHDQPNVAVAPDGRFVVVWAGRAEDGTNSRIFAQRFAVDGSMDGVAFQVSGSVTGGEGAPEVAADANANFVVVWHSFGQDGDGYGIFARRFAADGTPLGDEFQVNTFSEGQQSSPSVSSSGSGDFVVAWRDYTRDGIFAQRFDSAAVMQGDEFLMSSSAFADWGPSVSSDVHGNFVVVWSAIANSQFADIIRGQRFDSDGTPQGTLLEIQPTVRFVPFIPNVASSPTGQFAVAWTQSDFDFVGMGSAWQSFGADGTPLGEVYATTPEGAPSRGRNHAVAWLSNESFAVVWERESSAGQTLLAGQTRKADGGRAGQIVTLATTENFVSGALSAGADASGNLVVVWADESDIFGRRLLSRSSSCPVLVTLHGERDGGRIFQTLYRIRDRSMARSARGRRYIRQFYGHAREAALLLATHSELRDQTRRALRDLHPKLEALAQGRREWIGSGEIAAVESLMDAFAVRGSARLNRTIRKLREDLHNGSLEAAFNDSLRQRLQN